MRTLLLVGLMSSLALGCGDDDSGADAGRDTGPATTDAGSIADAGSNEDTGPGSDAGTEADAGAEGDAGRDAGTDASSGRDAGPDTDAGPDGTCGGFIGAVCPSRVDFCEYAMGCGTGDAEGMCVTPPESCPRILDPVCACDGNDYGNPCMAQMAGQSVASRGRCEVAAERCGGRGGVRCGETEYCAYTLDEMCGRFDATSMCMARPADGCPDLFDPVCGCDGRDYGNECEANAAGAAILFRGTCDEP